MRDMVDDEQSKEESAIQRSQPIDKSTTQVNRSSDITCQNELTEPQLKSNLSNHMVEKPKQDPSRQSSTDSTVTVSSSTSSQDFGRLRKLKELYGRSEEKLQIENFYFETVKEKEKCNLLVVSGSIGCGKTALANSLRETAILDGAMFVTWKFDNQKQFVAGDGFTEAIQHLFRLIGETQEPARSEIIDAIKEAGPEDNAILIDLFPGLADLIGPPESNVTANTASYSGRIMHIAKVFFRAVCAPHRPLVMLLDDVQNMDPCSAKFLSSLLVDQKNDGIMFLATISGCLEDYESTQKMIRDCRGGLHITHVVLRELPEDIVNQMVADILHVPLHISEPMTELVYHITEGNAVFVVEILRMMHETGILKFESTTKTWKCEEKDMEDVKSCTDVTSLLNRTMKCLPQQLQEMLKAAASLGSRISAKTLSLVFAAPVTVYLQAAEQLGLLCRIDDIGQTYRFVHSAVQQAAYALIPEEEKPVFHLALARRLWRDFRDERLEKEPKYLSFIMGQLTLAAPAMKSQKEKYAAVLLCLRGIKVEIEWSMFPAAAIAADLAISLLGENCWREEYDLSLTVYNNAAEIYYAIGESDKAEEAAGIVLRNARIYSDKVQAYSMKICVLNSAEKLSEAIQLGLEVLGELGVTFPSNCTLRHVRNDFLRTKWMMRNMSIDSMRRLPNMANTDSMAALRLLNLIFSSACTLQPFLAPLIAMRMVRISIKEGLCAISAFGFAAWGGLLCSYNREVELGAKFGELAMDVLDRFHSREWFARVRCIVYGIINTWNKPLRICEGPLEEAFNVGMETGDIEYAMLNAHLRSFILFDLGVPLPQLEEDVLRIQDEMTVVQSHVLTMGKPFLCMIAAFTHESGAKMYLSEMERQMGDVVVTPYMSAWVDYHIMLVSFIFRDTGCAAEHQDRCQIFEIFPYKDVDLASYYLLSGLVQIEMLRRTGKNQRAVLSRVGKLLKNIEKMSKSAPNFCFGKALLLKAELSAARGKHAVAFENFVGAINFCKGEALLWEQALANELCGRFMASREKIQEAKDFMEEAHSVYTAWGGIGKAAVLRAEIDEMFSLD